MANDIPDIEYDVKYLYTKHFYFLNYYYHQTCYKFQAAGKKSMSIIVYSTTYIIEIWFLGILPYIEYHVVCMPNWIMTFIAQFVTVSGKGHVILKSNFR